MPVSEHLLLNTAEPLLYILYTIRMYAWPSRLAPAGADGGHRVEHAEGAGAHLGRPADDDVCRGRGERVDLGGDRLILIMIIMIMYY
jgi:hypothetical protein